MSLPNWLEKAIEEVGTREVAGPGTNPRIAAYHQATTLKATDDAVAWCSAFACWCMHGGGAEPIAPFGILSPRSASARSWLAWGRQTEPRLGAVVVFSRGSNPAQGHVGFLLDSYGGMLQVLGGNQSDRVCIQLYGPSRVLGFRWPGGGL